MAVHSSPSPSLARRWRVVEQRLGLVFPKSLLSDSSALLFLEGVSNTPMIEKEEEWECLRRYKEEGDLGARQRLVESYLRYVVNTALRHMHKGLPFLDLIQEGTIGLFTAIDKFDMSRSVRLYHYSHWWISQAITRAISDKGRLIRIPVHMHEQIRLYQRQVADLTHQLQRPPHREEIARELHISVDRVEAIEYALTIRLQSLDDEVTESANDFDLEEDPLYYAEIVGDADHSLEDWVERADLSSQMMAALESLNPRARDILAMRYGLYDDHIYTLEELGKRFGLTRERIRQIEATAIHRLRTHKYSRSLMEYLT